jgi:DedD protein
MDDALKKRLLGAGVLIALAIIFIPALIGTDPIESPEIGKIPRAPESEEFAPTLLQEEAIAPQIPEKVEKPAPEPVAAVAPQPVPEKETAAVKPKPVKQTPAQAGLHSWAIQVGSFAQRENAQRLVEKLRKAGLQTPEPERFELEDQVLYRVKVGPMLQKSRADALLSKINKISGGTGRVVPYP